MRFGEEEVRLECVEGFLETMRVSELHSFVFVESRNSVRKTTCVNQILPAFG